MKTKLNKILTVANLAATIAFIIYALSINNYLAVGGFSMVLILELLNTIKTNDETKQIIN